MSTYHFVFNDRLGETLVEYDTNVDPPVMGDIVDLSVLTGGHEKRIFVVYDRCYRPIDEKYVEITFTLDLYDNEALM